MPVNKAAFESLLVELAPKKILLVAVSKSKSVEQIKELYDLGQRDFGENYVQELLEKQLQLPADIHWHFIGHLQSNKVKKIVPFIYLVQSVDSLKVLKEINKQAEKAKRVINCLLQVHLAEEETKFGLDDQELGEVIAYLAANDKELSGITIKGVMGMASLTPDIEKSRKEFRKLKLIFDQLATQVAGIEILSMGMSGDYRIAIAEGSNLIRIGTLLFGEREVI